jgi:hypothetical protein
VPSKKQRKRRQKELRHEYAFVTYDDDGNEVEVDPEELKAQRAEKEREQARPVVATKDGKKPARSAPARDARGRPIREIQPPSWSRTWKRAAAFTAVMFLALSFLAHGGSPVGRVLLTLAYGALFVPFLYLMDRVQYRQYLRRKAAAAAGTPARQSTKGAAARSAAAPQKSEPPRRGLRRGSRSRT